LLKKFVGGVRSLRVSESVVSGFVALFFLPVYVLQEGECKIFEDPNPIFAALTSDFNRSKALF